MFGNNHYLIGWTIIAAIVGASAVAWAIVVYLVLSVPV